LRAHRVHRDFVSLPCEKSARESIEVRFQDRSIEYRF
jgi:hypothetical protein